MTLEEAVQNAVKAYWKDKPNFKKDKKDKGNFKYTKKYFDRFEEAEFGTKMDYLKGDQ